MALDFGALPADTPSTPEPFTFRVSDKDLDEFKTLLQLSKIGPATWWNQQKERNLGVSRDWLIKAKDAWLNNFDWRKHEAYINSFPNFKLRIKDPEAEEIDIHFAALFSKKPDAIPIVFMHGFPASFTEFLPMLDLLAEKYIAETLPYHVIVPSLPDFALSGSSSRSVEMTMTQAARIMNQLMLDLGFGKGYVAQGGDMGSMLARMMSAEYSACKALHINMLMLDPTQKAPSRDLLTPEESHIMKRVAAWQQTGLAFTLQHGTRPATVGLAISSNPLALLAWVGEKLLEWTDPRQQFSMETILNWITFYWFTNTLPRGLYHATIAMSHASGKPYPISMEKPLCYSFFPYDLVVLPKAWAQEFYPNLTLFKAHREGGHFAPLEQPAAFLDDVEEFIGKIGHLF
ncbi:Alpha/Beta hydrolase protein [Xylariaceae sp. FL1272]|nr:Alpha/Beta hydrolase protein [Xylariaceae sp. FL1272]